MQRLYKRRKADSTGIMRSTFGSIMEPVETYNMTPPTNSDDSTDNNENVNCDCKDIFDALDQNKDGVIDKSQISFAIELKEF